MATHNLSSAGIRSLSVSATTTSTGSAGCCARSFCQERRLGKAVRCPARSLHRVRLKAEWRDAFDEGRLILLSPFPDYVRRPTSETAYRCNQMVAALADTILIAHARPDSSTWRLTEEVLAWDKPVYTLPHKANEPLLDLGVRLRPEG